MISNKEAVAFSSILASGLLAALKLTVGLTTGSLGILSEAAHSGLDFIATILTFCAVRIGDRPADRNHPYGHGKVESVAALAETALLFGTSAWIVVAAARRLLGSEAGIEPSWTAVAVMAFSMLLDFFRSRTLSKVAKATGSPALQADAMHFRADIYSSGVVIIGLGLVKLGYPIADAIAAIAVAIFVLRAGWHLGRETIGTLTDMAPEGINEQVRAAAESVPGVARVEGVRGGPRGSTVSVDVEIAVARTLPLERVSEIKDAVVARIHEKLPDAQVVLQANPRVLDDETVLDRVLVIAATQRVPVHHVTVQHTDEQFSVSFDLEVDGNQTIQAAHVTASRLERAIRDELGEGVEVESHIEPLQVNAVIGDSLPWPRYRAIRDIIEQLAEDTPLLLDAHDIRVRRTAHGLYISLHCHVPPDETVETVHSAASTLENQIREKVPETRRIIVHTEPALPGELRPDAAQPSAGA